MMTFNEYLRVRYRLGSFPTFPATYQTMREGKRLFYAICRIVEVYEYSNSIRIIQPGFKLIKSTLTRHFHLFVIIIPDIKYSKPCVIEKQVSYLLESWKLRAQRNSALPISLGLTVITGENNMGDSFCSG